MWLSNIVLCILQLLLNVTELTVAFSDLRTGEKYVAQAVSWNQHGSSVPSNNVSFSAATPEGAENPVPPTTLEEAWVRPNQVNLTWSWAGITIGGAKIPKARFILFYSEHIMDKKATWTKVETEERWAVANDLERNTHYTAYVIAREDASGKESGPSASITFDTVQTGRPRTPFILFKPDKGHYLEGEELEVLCQRRPRDTEMNLNLTFGPGPKETVVGSGEEVSGTIAALTPQHATQQVVCRAQNNNGKSYSHGQILLYFKPRVKPRFANEKSRSILSKLDVEFFCRVDSFPSANVSWHFTGSMEKVEVENLVPVNRVAIGGDVQLIGPTQHLSDPFAFFSTLRISNVKQKQAGFYHCRACNELGCNSTTFNLKVEAFPLPKGPHNVEKCCKKQGVQKECMAACSFNLDRSKYDGNACIHELSKLLYCAKDGADHRECCATNGVPQNCLGLCDLMIKDEMPEVDYESCGLYSTTVLRCMQEAHAVLPGFPRDVEVKQLEEGVAMVEWKQPDHNPQTVQKYAVYYRPKSEEKYMMESTGGNATSVMLRGLETGVEYEVRVLAANYHGISLFTNPQAIVLKAMALPRKGGASVAGTALAIIFCLLLAAVIILGVVYFSRRPTHVPAFFGKLRNRARRPGSTSEQVTFENPIYPDYERDPQIRGLPGDASGGEREKLEGRNGHAEGNGSVSTWETQGLESIAEEESPQRPQRGLKYTQLT